MRYILLVIASFSIYIVSGQSQYEKIDKWSATVPDSLKDYASISRYLTRNYHSEEEKIRSLYVWITHNIEYDVDESEDRETAVLPIEEGVKRILASRKGICHDYSELFLMMCEVIGIEAYYIHGFSRTSNSGAISYRGHAWNGVKISSGYYLLDLTWGAGYVKNDQFYPKFKEKYFLVRPEVFVKRHLPLDPIWQFLNHPITLEEFITKDFSKLGTKGAFDFDDLLCVNPYLSERDQLIQSIQRIEAYVQTNKWLSKEIKNNALIYDRIGLYLATRYYNYGVKTYNEFIGYKDRGFKNPNIKDEEIIPIITQAERGVKKAREILFRLKPEDEGMKKTIHRLWERIPKYLAYIYQEKDYAERYLWTWKPFRIFVY
jgi:hypothetical protein